MKCVLLSKLHGFLFAWAVVSLLGQAPMAAATPVVRFSLSVNDDGTGALTPGMFAIYADVSPDNGGLFSFSIDLTGNITEIFNLAPQGQFRKTGSRTMFLGFSHDIREDAATGRLSGMPDLAKAVVLIPVYGFGQLDGDLNSRKPAGYNNFFDTNPNQPGSAYQAHLLLGIGSYSGSAPTWAIASPDNNAFVFDDCTGLESIPAQLSLGPIGAGGSSADMGSLNAAAAMPCAAVPEPGVILLTLSGLVGVNLRTGRAKRG